MIKVPSQEEGRQVFNTHVKYPKRCGYERPKASELVRMFTLFGEQIDADHEACEVAQCYGSQRGNEVVVVPVTITIEERVEDNE